jgi:hypothetical protein
MKWRIVVPSLAALIGIGSLLWLLFSTADDEPRHTTFSRLYNRLFGRVEFAHDLSFLAKRCKHLHDLQKAMLDEIVDLDCRIQATGEANADDLQAARKLADKQRAIIALTDRTIAFLEADGTAVAFPEVFRQLRDDMRKIERQLRADDASKKTQDLAVDAIETLQEMNSALVKSRGCG